MSLRSRFLTVLAALLLSLASDSCAPRPTETPPPVILISIDTLRADRLPAYGYDGVATPAIDGLRRDGVLFSRAYTSVPLTLPAHTSLLTGQQPYTHGVRDNVGYRLDRDAETTLPGWLKARGYATGAAVSAYVLRGDTGLGTLFDHYDDGIGQGSEARALGEAQRLGGETRQRAEAWIRQQRQKPREENQPLFFFLHLFEPHTPYEPPEPFRGQYADPYDGEIASADAIVGDFLRFLRDQGIYNRAMILLLADHGEGLGDHGEAEHGIFLYPETLRVPLIVKLPGNARAGQTVEEPAQLLDIFPTVAALLGSSPPADLPGSDLFALDGQDRRLYAESLYARLHLGWSELRSLVDRRYQYIEAPRPELYDLEADPGARNNILTQERRVYRAMEEALSRHDAAWQAPGAVDEEEAARLAALGYLTAPSSHGDQERPDPKDALPALEEMRRAFALAAAGGCQEAVPAYRGLLERFPAMLDARVELGACLRQLGDREGALEAYREALRRSPQAADGILISMAEIHLESGDLQEAEEHARAVLTGLPARTHALLARIALERGQPDAALESARAAVAAETVPRPEATLVLARALLATGDAAAALEELERLPAEPGTPPPWYNFLRGDALARLGRNAEAEAAFRAEMHAFPQNSQAFANLAVLLAAEQRFGEIEPLLRAMVAANPLPETCSLAADTAGRLGDREGAERWRRQAAAGC